MKRVVVELDGNLAFCGVHKGYEELDGKRGLFVETDTSNGLRVWCPESMIKEIYEVEIDE